MCCVISLVSREAKSTGDVKDSSRFNREKIVFIGYGLKAEPKFLLRLFFLISRESIVDSCKLIVDGKKAVMYLYKYFLDIRHQTSDIRHQNSKFKIQI